MKEVDRKLLKELKRSLRIWLQQAKREGWSYAEKWEIIPEMIEKDVRLTEVMDEFCDEHVKPMLEA